MQIGLLDIPGRNPASSGCLLSLGAAGQLGFGEVCPPASAVKPDILPLMRAVADLIATMDARNMNVVLDAVHSITSRDPMAGPLVLSAIDMALHDLNGKLRGCPVHVMLGGRYRSEIALSQYLPCGSVLPDGQDAVAAVTLEHRQEPVRQTGSYGPGSALGWLTSAIEQFGSHVQIDIDAGGTFDNPALARTFAEGLLTTKPRLNLGLLQPLDEADLVGHAALSAALPLPVILDRSVHSAKVMGQIVRLGAADRVVVNLERVGGLRSAMPVVAIAEAASIGVSSATSCHTAIGAAAALHLAVVLHDTLPARLDNFLRAGEPIADAGFVLERGLARVEAGPGLGVLLRDEAVSAFQSVL